MSKTYRIKPLDWNEDRFGGLSAQTPFGALRVFCHDENTDEWRWSYCFDEYYDEDESECDGKDDGKAKAEEFWIDRISGVLVDA